ncbi:FAD-dependent oxidoreductase [Lactobacillus pasteurii]|uniref:Pyridine nucleotide-disulphide oxidoreductase n=1 Tax=Lactobacillus pasteurii DSM 23907 = CRBIP 24.76 TaxID=1423790 RepID=I7LAQ6_9LACO|nr:FAD-dependent oxidoreductase [Lactobacillus pasteurii]TDG77371.1 hypothetical protein C5L33_000814 [Lactobacillus pasteurii]CCI84916.1 Pyridine nucleotide-disulphide oxidoreductase [Lactobacillus pasteurii DSM 23907 = CRBIP 24.76]
MKKYQNIIVGFGKGGKTLAKTLAMQGQEVLVIEQSDQMYGGTCINIGCLPSKNLIINGEKGMPFSQASEAKRALTSKLRNKNYHMIADLETATVLDGKAKFTSNYELEVTQKDGNKLKVQGERIFINTGATPRISKIDGLKLSQNIVTSKEAMDWDEKPANLGIIGAGYIGLEFAGMFNSFNSKVTVIDGLAQILSKEDQDVSEAVFQDLTAAGINFRLDSKIEKVEDSPAGVKVTYQQAGEVKEETFDKLLVAAGRKANTQDLGIENTDIELTEYGAIKVDNKLRTNVANIWALGDVNGGPQFTYISLDDFRIVKDQLLGNGERSTKDREFVPYTAFITPPLSAVGMKEHEAKAAGYDIKVYKLMASGIPKAHVAGDARGLYKVIVDQKTKQILGATIYGLESHEVINLISLVMKLKAPYTVLRDMIYTHPTMAEALNDLLN